MIGNQEGIDPFDERRHTPKVVFALLGMIGQRSCVARVRTPADRQRNAMKSQRLLSAHPQQNLQRPPLRIHVVFSDRLEPARLNPVGCEQVRVVLRAQADTYRIGAVPAGWKRTRGWCWRTHRFLSVVAADC